MYFIIELLVSRVTPPNIVQVPWLVVTCLATSALSQYGMDREMRPDVTFDTHNDHFDISSIIQDQNRYYDDAKHRRSEDIKLKPIMDTISNSVSIKDDFVFAEADNDSTEGGTVADFENNLQKFREGSRRSLLELAKRLHDKAMAARRSLGGAPDPEQEVLMAYAVPVQMDIHGYIQTPLVE